jgi:hypothetical protein
MNYYEARKTKDGKGWHFTGMNDGRIWPEGYCRDHEPHAERWEAEDCFRAYLLDGIEDEEYGNWGDCEVCGAPTKKGLTARPPHGNGYRLCDDHRTPDHLAQLMGKPNQIVSSY